MPSKNEEKIILNTLKRINKSIISKIDYEILIIDDFSTDNTWALVKSIKNSNKIKLFKNIVPGLGSAIKLGIERSSKKYICIYMTDQSDSLNDLFKYYKIITKGDYDAVLGSRFIKGSKLIKYPLKKLIYNRIFNNICKLMFLNSFNDYTNAFKIYKKKVLVSFFPIVSENFNVFLELPLKIISRKYKYSIIAINWKNRNSGVAKFKIKELGSKYLFTLFYCFLEKILLDKKVNK